MPPPPTLTHSENRVINGGLEFSGGNVLVFSLDRLHQAIEHAPAKADAEGFRSVAFVHFLPVTIAQA